MLRCSIASRAMGRPFYIALEGSEGCGKSTHAQRLGEAIGAVVTRETGGTPIGERLRAILHDTTVLDLDDRAETLIVAADRAQHMAEVVRPALDRRPPCRQRPVGVLHAGLPGLRPRPAARRGASDQRMGDGRDLARPRRAADDSRRRDRGADAAGASSTASSRPATTSTRGSTTGSRRWPRPNPSAGSVVDGNAVEGRCRGRDPRRGRRNGSDCEPCRHIGLGRGRRPAGRGRSPDACRGRARARLSLRRARGLDQEGGGAGLRGPAARRATTRPNATPSWCCAASTPTCARSPASAPRSRSGRRARSCALASLAPIEGDRKVMILDEFHLLSPEGAAILLKTIEEPPPSTTFLVLADFVPHDLVTISSRCARIEFRTIQASDIEQRLREEGVDDDAAARRRHSAGGSIERARVLASDPDLADRRRAFATVPRQLDGTGSTVMRIVDDLLARIEAAATPLAERHAARGCRARRADRSLRRARQRQEDARGAPQARAAAAPHRRVARRAHRDGRLVPRRDGRRHGRRSDTGRGRRHPHPRRDGGVRAQPQRGADAAGPTVVASRVDQRALTR